MRRHEVRAALLKSLQRQGEPTPSDLTEQMTLAGDADYWRTLNPHLSVGLPSLASERGVTPSTAYAREASLLEREGYFELATVLDPALLRDLALGVEHVRQRGWPPVFGFVYDEMWTLTRVPEVAGLLSTLMGSGYVQLSRTWVHYVAPSTRARGWRPHKDYPRLDAFLADGSPARLNLWIPLTNATLDNGCMYVIPTHLEREIAEILESELIAKADCLSIVQCARAVPAAAGSILGWHSQLMHWGSVSTARARGPRVALSVEFLSSRATPQPGDAPLLDPSLPIPSFRARLSIIARNLSTYTGAGGELLATRFRGLAQRILDAEPGGRTKSDLVPG